MQRITGIMRRAFRAGFWSILDQALFTGANTVLNIVLARALGPEDFGAYWLAFSIYLLLMPIHGALLVEPMLVFGAGRFGEAWPRYFSLMLIGHAVVSLAGALLLLLGGIGTHLVRPGVFADALIAVAVASPFLLLQVLLRRACYTIRRPRFAALAGMAYALLILAGVFALQALNVLSVTTALLLLGITSLLSVAWLVPVVRTAMGAAKADLKADGFAREVLTKHFEYGRWAVGYRLLRWIPNNLAFVLLPMFGGLGATGTLRAMLVLFMPLVQATTAISAIIVPNLVAARQSGAFLRRVRGLAVAILAAALLYAVLVGLGGDSLLALIYGDSYAGMGWLLWVLGIGVALGVGREILSAAMRALERPDLVFTTGIVSTAAFVLIGTPLIALSGLVGAGYAFIVPAVVQLGLLARTLVNHAKRGQIRAVGVVKP